MKKSEDGHEDGIAEVCARWSRTTCGTVEVWELLSAAAGLARAISSLMVIFSKPQLEDLGSEERRACEEEGRE